MTEAEVAPEEPRKLVPTSVDDINKIQREGVVELPAFLDGTPFVAKLRRPSITQLARLGQIPNNLSAAVDELMAGSSESKTPLKERADVLALIAEAALVEPTFSEVEEVIDSFQLMAIWQFVMYGEAMLEPFRQFRSVLARKSHGGAVQDEAERASEG